MTVRPPASTPEVKRRMERQARRDTQPEMLLRRELHRRGLRYRVDYRVEGSRRRVDIAFTKVKVAVLVHGCFWHACPEHGSRPKANAAWWDAKFAATAKRDKAAAAELRSHGWEVIVVWEHEAPDVAALRVANLVEQRRNLARGGNF